MFNFLYLCYSEYITLIQSVSLLRFIQPLKVLVISRYTLIVWVFSYYSGGGRAE